MSLRGSTRILTGDVSEQLAKMPANTFHGCLTDPPYGLAETRSPQRKSGTNPNAAGFMGMKWDADVPPADVWREVLRVLKPGAFMLAFGGSRTFHRLAVAIEDAGFEIRDCIMWLYGQGFPKSHDISKGIDASGGKPHLSREVGRALKASRERRGLSIAECDARFCKSTSNWSWFEGRPRGQRMPDGKTFAAIAKQWPELETLRATVAAAERETIETRQEGGRRIISILGTSAKEYDVTAPATPEAQLWNGYGTALKPAYEPVLVCMKPTAGTFARNAIEHGVAGLAIDAARIGTGNDRSSGGIDYSMGYHAGGRGRTARPTGGRWPANVILDEAAGEALDAQSGILTSGANPTRRKSSKTRNTYGDYPRGECIAYRGLDRGGASRFFYCAKASRSERGAANTHPTVKPIALAEYLARLILPPAAGAPRRLLVPFSGSGSEIIGAKRAGWHHITGIEQSAEYVEIAKRRTAAA